MDEQKNPPELLIGRFMKLKSLGGNRVILDVRQPEVFTAMSIYGHLNCHDCRQTLFLGKALHCSYRPFAFHIGGPKDPANWARQQLNQVLWKFLADHSGHRIDVRLEHDMTDDMFGYQDIGGDTDDAPSFETYLAGWPDLHL